VFLTFIALSSLLILVLPVVVAVVAGDSVAGEAGYGTLRYLLAVPAGRTRLLAVKFAVIVTFGLCATFIVSAVALVAGAALFPVGPVTLLSGTTVSLPTACSGCCSSPCTWRRRWPRSARSGWPSPP
jgi:ABC-2 type transport system permease protein